MIVSTIASPVGQLKIEMNGKKVRSLHFCHFERAQASEKSPSARRFLASSFSATNRRTDPSFGGDSARNDSVYRLLRRELCEYFSGRRKKFSVRTAPQGTVFQRRVRQEFLKIPYGRAVSYRTIAERIGKPTAARAVGQAIGRNPVCILIPCHRVIRSGGAIGGSAEGRIRRRFLGGYAGGVSIKKKLLDLEKAR